MRSQILRAALAASVTFTALAAAQEPITTDAKTRGIAVYVSALVYDNPLVDTLSVVEFPFTLNRSDFEFFKPDSADEGFYARIFAQITITNMAGEPVDSTSTYFSVRASDLTDARRPDVMLFNRLSRRIKAGIYAARLLVIDAVSKRTQTMTLAPFAVSPPQKNRLELAGGTLAYAVTYMADTAATSSSPLIRNGYRILYDPPGAYKAGDSTAYVYAELYNLQGDTLPISTYRTSFAIYDRAGELIRDFGYRDAKKPGETAVVTQSLDISHLLPRSYVLRVVAEDPSSGQRDTINLPLHVVSDEARASLTSTVERPDAYDSLSLRDKINLTSYLLTAADKSAMVQLTDSGKINFLGQFWKERKQMQGTTSVVGRQQMAERYQYAQQSFSTDTRRTNGWATDRGRIYILHGKWDEKTEVQTPRVGDPFVIWRYHDMKGGTVFVFQDLKGNNDFVLVHSNAPGERYDNGWAEQLKEELIDIY